VIASIVTVAEKMSVTRELAIEWLFQLLWVCMVVTEAVQLVTNAYSYWSVYFWVRQGKYISVREGEPYMVNDEFPLALRYVDLLHLLCLLSAMTAIDSVSVYTIGSHGLALLYGVYVYFKDKYAFLRVYRMTWYRSSGLDAVGHYVFAVPLAVLALYPLQMFFIESLPWLNIVILAACILLFLVFVAICHRCISPRRELSDVPYVEAASLTPYNYFNTNPVHVLRTLHFPSIVVPPLYPYLPGKEYLQGGTFADYDDSVRLLETLMLLAKSPLKGLQGAGNPQDFG